MSAVQRCSVLEEISHKVGGFTEHNFPRAWPFLKLMRMNEPENIFFAFWPFTWGLLLAANTSSITLAETVFYLVLFLLSSVAWASATCVVNDMWDKNIDSKVERCKNRPLASGEVSMMQAAILFTALIVICILLSLPTNDFCQNVCLFIIIPAILYPASKRVIACPAVSFGIISNWGILIGWSAIMKNLDISVCGPLYFGAICWTVMYDSIYGSQDKKDDVKVGIHSMALTFGSYIRIVMILAGMGAISGLTLAGVAAGMEWPYYVGMLVASIHIGNQVFTVDLDNPLDCRKKFNDNATFGFLVFLAMIAGSWGIFQRSMTTVPAMHEL